MNLTGLFTDKQASELNMVIMDRLRKAYPLHFTETGAMDHKWFEQEVRPKKHIYIREDKNSISFTLARGKEPGCTFAELLECVRLMADEFIPDTDEGEIAHERLYDAIAEVKYCMEDQ